MNEDGARGLAHCVEKVRSLVAADADDRRDWLQLGYNLGRISELTGLGRSVWDAWKGPVGAGDREAMRRLADLLPSAEVPE